MSWDYTGVGNGILGTRSKWRDLEDFGNRSSEENEVQHLSDHLCESVNWIPCVPCCCLLEMPRWKSRNKFEECKVSEERERGENCTISPLCRWKRSDKIPGEFPSTSIRTLSFKDPRAQSSLLAPLLLCGAWNPFLHRMPAFSTLTLFFLLLCFHLSRQHSPRDLQVHYITPTHDTVPWDSSV